MMYLVVILIGVLLLLYFGGRWLAHEAREVGKLLRKGWLQVSGGQTPEKLIREAHMAFAQRGLGPPDLVAVPSEADKTYDALRRHVLDRVPEPALPAAVGTVLAIHVDSATAFLRSVSAAAGQAGSERAEFLSFEQITELQPVALEPHPGIASPAESALELQTASGEPYYQLPIDPAWGVTPEDFAEHIRTMVRQRRRPAGGTVILR